MKNNLRTPVARAEKVLQLIVNYADHAEIFQLVREGIDYDVRDGWGRTPLMAAVHTGAHIIVRAMIDMGADPNLPQAHSQSLLMYAILIGQDRAAIALIEGGAKLDTQDMCGGTALHFAISRGRADVVRSLLAHGARTDIPGANGTTARECAEVWNGSNFAGYPPEIIFLLEKKAIRELADKGMPLSKPVSAVNKISVRKKTKGPGHA